MNKKIVVISMLVCFLFLMLPMNNVIASPALSIIDYDLSRTIDGSDMFAFALSANGEYIARCRNLEHFNVYNVTDLDTSIRHFDMGGTESSADFKSIVLSVANDSNMFICSEADLSGLRFRQFNISSGVNTSIQSTSTGVASGGIDASCSYDGRYVAFIYDGGNNVDGTVYVIDFDDGSQELTGDFADGAYETANTGVCFQMDENTDDFIILDRNDPLEQFLLIYSGDTMTSQGGFNVTSHIANYTGWTESDIALRNLQDWAWTNSSFWIWAENASGDEYLFKCSDTSPYSIQDDWDVPNNREQWLISQGGNYAFSVNDGGTTEVYEIDASSSSLTADALGANDMEGCAISPDGSHFACWNVPQGSGDLYVYHTNIEDGDGAGGAGGGEGSNPLTSYNQYCDTPETPTDSGLTGIRNNQYLETKWGIKLTDETPVRAVDLYISYSQYLYISNDPTDYHCYLNGVSMGEGTSIGENGGHYYVQFLLDNEQYVTEGYAVFEFKCDEYYTNGADSIYWSPVYDTGAVGGSHYHNNPVWYSDGDTVGQGTNYYDLWICLYYRFAQQNPSYTDDIWTVQHEDTNYNEFEEYSNILITGTLSTLTPSTYVQLNHDGSRYEGGIYGGLGALVSDTNRYDFMVSFNPTSKSFDGSWNCTLVRSGSIVDSYNFTIINRSEVEYNGLITSSPNPQDVNQPITVTYLFNTSYYDNQDAQVWVSDDNRFSNLEDTMLKSYISEDGTLTYHHSEQGIIYFMLVLNYGGTYHTIAMSDPQVVGSNALNQVGIMYQEIYLTDDEPVQTQRVFGSQSYGGRQVTLFLNNVTLKDVSYEPYFDFSYQVTQAGLYVLEMKYYDSSGSWITLDTVTYTVYDEREDDSETGTGLTNDETNFLIGLGVMLVFSGIGFGIGTKMKSDNGELYLGLTFLVIGACISAYFSLFELWIPFVIALFPIAYIIGEIFGNRR